MKKKRFSILIAVVAIMAFLLSYIISYANTGETIYVNLTKVDTSGVGYGIGNPANGTNEAGKPATSAYIWNIMTHDSASSTTASKNQRNLYCIKGNYGNSWNTSNDKILAYNLSYDLQADREKLLKNIVDNSNDADDVVKTLLSESGYYRELLWILDNSYIEGKTDKIQFLSNIGIKYDSTEGRYYYEPISGYDYSSYVSGNSTNSGYSKEHLMTDADIKAVQRAAIWYFTNYLQDKTNDAVFNNKNSSSDWLTITNDGNSYQQLANYNSTDGEGAERFEQVQILYNYLIDAATKNASKYTSANNYTIVNGASVNTTGLTKNSNNKYRLTATRVGSNYVIGPIKIDKNGTLTSDVSIKVTDQSNKTITYTFTDSTGKSLGTTDIKTLVGKSGGFYISVDRNSIEKVNIKIDVTKEVTKKTLWLNGTEDTSSIKLKAEQPIVEVTREEETIPTEFEASPEEFDLALRKYITQVNGKNVANTRVPNIDTSTLNTGTTAKYKHRKDPVIVEDKDEITYTLAIYNEGNKAGYASEIVDQLPTGLISSPNNSATVVSKDKSGNAKNTYTLTYNTTLNQITLKITGSSIKDLNAYTTGKLDYETIDIKCKVAQTPDTKNQIVLTNVAFISKAHDSDGNKDITTSTIGDDRDSAPGAKPNVNKDNMQDYKGKTTNPDDLSKSDNYYEGEQDDDDFEKVAINPVKKVFDLALFKHIAAVSKDQKIEAGEYITDTKNIDGTYLRAPVVTAINAETGKITYKEHDKEPLTVNPGDYVLYTIRVYNEGEVNGYASKIKDTLPIGLEFVVDNEEYNGIWKLENLDTDGRQIVSTTWYAKGQGAELNAKPGDANYKANLLKALNKEGAISNTEPANPDYIDAQVLCRVKEDATSDRILVNNAEIADDSDENGNPIDDVDSTPDKWIDGEDDQDIEKIKVRTDGKYNLVLVKQDKDGVQLNSTAKFEVTTNGVKKEEEITGRLVIAKNVPVDADHLTDDVYVIKETKAPDEYCEFDGTITVTVSKKVKADGSGYETSIKYTVIDSKGNDITNKKDANVYLNEDGNIYVEVKNYKEPEIHKGVKDVTNQDSGYDADEVHSWVIESDIPRNIDDYKFYDITDDIDYRLKFEGIENVTVKIGNTKLTEGTDYKISYAENATGVQEKTKSGTLILTFIDTENSMNASSKIKDNAGGKIQVTFKTTFAKDANGKLLAVMGEQVENQAKLDYKNSSSDNKITKESEKPEVHTGGVTLYKYYVENNNKVSLSGAKFGIYATADDAKNNKNIIATAVSDENGVVKFIGLKYGGDANSSKNNLTDKGTYEYDANNASTKYWIAEIEAPEGFKKYSEIIEVIINKDSYNETQIKYEVENKKLSFDLALRKFITKIQDNEVTSRIPQVKIDNGKITYEHSKDPLLVCVQDKVIYTIRVYNEGEVDGYASEITDDIPDYLEYLPEESTNVQYMWKMYDKDGNETSNVAEAVKVKTKYLSKDNNEENLLKAFDGKNVSYKDVQIAFKVKDPSSKTTIITNHAQISDDSDKKGNPIEDIDSKPDEWNDGEDDQDIENIRVQYLDLALRKFITKIQDKDVTSRVPQVKIEDGKVTYEHSKDPLNVHVNDKIIYTIRVYNEGEIDGYASEVTDDIPEYLEYLPEESTNVQYMWKMYDKDGNETTNVSEAVKVRTKYLSKDNGEDKLLKAFDGKTVDYKDVQIAFKVKDPNSNTTIITNHAQISDDSDKDGKPVDDIDSKPDEWNEGEDDQDEENVKVEYFDLALLKFVSKVIVGENGKETITETGYNGHEDPEPVVKVELHKKNLKNVTVKFGYGITITNEGDIPGYATEITDYVPEGLRFEAADNPLWTDEGNNVISTKQLEKTLLQPGESATVEVILTWINGADNLALKTNIAEISEDKNDYDVPDRDSTPDNKKDGEDDIDIAKVILAVKTGTAKTYFTLAIGLLTIVLVGTVLIKKYVI